MHLTLALLALLCGADEKGIEVTVSAGKHDRKNAVVHAEPLVLPESLGAARTVVLDDGAGLRVVGQLSAPGLGDPMAKPAAGNVHRTLDFVLPSLKAGASVTLRGTVTDQPDAPGGPLFRWVDTAGENSELRFGDRPVLRYMLKPIDESGKGTREQTYKVYHHVFDPAGTRLVTKGPGGQFTHHRGLFYGFKCTYGGKTVDTWHCTKDTHLAHDKVLASDTGKVMGRHRVQVRWHGDGKEVFALEERELAAYDVPGGLLIDFSSSLKSTKGTVKVDGDPQHAGFHFRADNEVSEKNAKQTIFVRPDGAGKPGETRNWPGQKAHADLPWDTMSFVLGGKRYTAAYLDHPGNPKEARYSERDYGRFGSYFTAQFDEAKTLDVRYRVWLQEGEMKVEDAARLSADFVEPPGVRVK